MTEHEIKINRDTKEAIDNMNYIGMLSLWRNAPSGHPYFEGETGEYFSAVMKNKRDKISDAEHTKASKSIGWG